LSERRNLPTLARKDIMHTLYRVYMDRARAGSEYFRKLVVAADMADDAYLLGGLDGMRDDLASIRHIGGGGGSTLVSEYERLYHRQILRS
jgi:hypothetical protein